MIRSFFHFELVARPPQWLLLRRMKKSLSSLKKRFLHCVPLCGTTVEMTKKGGRFKKAIIAHVMVAVLLLPSTVHSVLAAPIDIQLNNACCEREYAVYGDEQPEMKSGECVVTVEVDEPAVDQAQETDEIGLADGFSSAGESLLSPLSTLFSKLRVKKNLLVLARLVFEAHTEQYHAFLDKEVFGKMIAKVSELETSEDLQAFLDEQEGECSSENPQPECLAERALCSYEKYTGVLFHEAGQTLLDTAAQSQDLQTILSILQQRDQSLVEEAQHSEQALDTALAVYSQFFQTYRLHLRFKEVIAALVKVRNTTAFMNTLVGCIPNKFVGVATTKCN